MKECPQCGETKGLLEFNKNKTKKDGFQHQCRACQREKARLQYEKSPHRQIEANRTRRRRNREENRNKIIEYKQSSPCHDCGVSHASYVMDFDHVRGSKSGLISEMVAGGRPWSVIEDEIAKCDLVCSNCHRYRTFARTGQIRGFMEEDDVRQDEVV